MSDAPKAWADGWASNPLSFFQSMFPKSSPSAASPESSAMPLGEQFAELRDSWANSIAKWSELARQGDSPGVPTPQALRELFAPAQWGGSATGALDAGLRRLLEGPRYATLWDFDRQWLELQRLAMQRDRDVASFQAVVQKAWGKAFERFSASFADVKGASVSTWRELVDRWLAIANETLVEAHRTEEFIDAQRRMLRSSSDHRLQERKLAEACCAAFHVPTRTEMDEMQRTVTELKRELRTLRHASSPSGHAAAKPEGKRRARGTSSSVR